jgi:hypothetical protein
MRKSDNRGRLTHPHTSQQQFGLTVEQLQHFSFEIVVAKRHAREMVAVEHRALWRPFGTSKISDRGLRHPGLPIFSLLIGAEFGSSRTKTR